MGKRLNLTLSQTTYDLVSNHAKRVGLSEGDVIRNLIATHIKPEAPATTTAKPAAQPRRALTHEEKLFGMEAPYDNGFPSEDEMLKRRQAVLDALE